MPLTGPQLRAQLADRNVHPIRTVGSSSAPLGSPGLSVTVDLVYAGVQFKPEDVFDALETKFGAGRVTTDRDSFGRSGPLQFRIR